MLDFLRALPGQPLSARRRFVVLATAFSFTLIVLVWVGILGVANRRSAELRAQLALPAPQTVEPPAAGPAQPVPPPPEPAATSEEPVAFPNLQDIAASISEALGSRR